MNAIQTFWTTPGLSADLIPGGWLDPRYHFMGWSLSACLLDQHFEKTILHTDTTGQQILVDLLGLPYNEVRLTQEGLGLQYPRSWWVMRKINSYNQPAPFLHVDGDAFLWDGLPTHVQTSPIIAQNDQKGFGCYDIAARQLTGAGVTLPSFLSAPNVDSDYEAVNMGVVGGTDITFFRHYVNKVRYFYDTQLADKAVNMLEIGYVNTLIEECFFRQYAIHRKKPVSCIITEKLHQEYKSISNSFDQSYGLTHLIGQSKKDIFYCKQVEFELKRRFPKVYKRVTDLVEHGWRNKTTFSLAGHEAFLESNVVAQTVDSSLTVTVDNHEELMTTYQHQSKLVSIIEFEREKYRVFSDALEESDALATDQQQRLALLERLANQRIGERLADELCFSETVPLMRFQYLGENPFYLLTAYDFAWGYRHISHRILDDLTLFILYSCGKPITLAALIGRAVNKNGSGEAGCPEKLLNQLDLRIKELILFGLIDYQSVAVTDECPVESYQ